MGAPRSGGVTPAPCVSCTPASAGGDGGLRGAAVERREPGFPPPGAAWAGRRCPQGAASGAPPPRSPPGPVGAAKLLSCPRGFCGSRGPAEEVQNLLLGAHGPRSRPQPPNPTYGPLSRSPTRPVPLTPPVPEPARLAAPPQVQPTEETPSGTLPAGPQPGVPSPFPRPGCRLVCRGHIPAAVCGAGPRRRGPSDARAGSPRRRGGRRDGGRATLISPLG